VRGIELRVDGRSAEGAFLGIADLVLAAPDAVVDLKWGTGERDAELETGTALQLAVYAFLTRGEAAGWPAIAYFILRSGTLLANRGPSAEATWTAALASYRDRLAEQRQGLVTAAAIADEAVPEPAVGRGLVDGRLMMPPCEYCAYGDHCGRSGAGA
jgi:hypothetical protein